MSSGMYSVASSCEYNRKSTGATSSCTSSVQVAVRVKPLSDDELVSDVSCIKVYDNENSVRVVNNNNGTSPRNTGSPRLRAANLSSSSNVFTFDGVFHGNSIDESERIFVRMIDPIIKDLASITGHINSSILLYGEKGSGKTSCLTSSTFGIIPRSLARIYRSLQYRKARESCESKYDFQVSIQCVEILNKEIIDLLASDNTQYPVSNQTIRSGRTTGTNILGKRTTSKLTLRGLNTDSPHIEGAIHEIATDVDEAMKCIQLCLDSRLYRFDNDRAGDVGGHVMITVFLSQTVEGTEINSKINFVDMASPQHFDTVGSVIPRAVKFFRDRCDINQSLLVLGIVLTTVWAEHKFHIHLKSIASIPFVPYRDSLLTSALKGSVGADNKTILVACIASGLRDCEKTIDVLRFANRIKALKPPSDLLYLRTDEDEIPDMSMLRNDTFSSSERTRSISPRKRLATKQTSGIKSKSDENKNVVSTPPRAIRKREFKSPASSLSSGSPYKETAASIARKQNMSTSTTGNAKLSGISPATVKKTKNLVAARTLTPFKQPVSRSFLKAVEPTVRINNKVSPRKTTASAISTQSTPIRSSTQPVAADTDPSEMSDLLDALLDPSQSNRDGSDTFELSGLLDALLDPTTPASLKGGAAIHCLDASSIDAKSDHTLTFDLSTTIRRPSEIIDADAHLFGVNLDDPHDEDIGEDCVPVIAYTNEISSIVKDYFSESETESSPATSDRNVDVAQYSSVLPTTTLIESAPMQLSNIEVDRSDVEDNTIFQSSNDLLEKVDSEYIGNTVNFDAVCGEEFDRNATIEVAPPAGTESWDPDSVQAVSESMEATSDAQVLSTEESNEFFSKSEVENDDDKDVDDLLAELLDDDSASTDNDSDCAIAFDENGSSFPASSSAPVVGAENSQILFGTNCGDGVLTSDKNESQVVHNNVEEVPIVHEEVFESIETKTPVKDFSNFCTDHVSNVLDWKEPVESSVSCESTVMTCESTVMTYSNSVAGSVQDSFIATTGSSYDESESSRVSWRSDSKAFHVGDIDDAALDSRLSRKNMLFTRATLREAVEKSSKSCAEFGLPEVMDIPPLPMNNDDLSRLLKASGLILNEHGDFALPSNKFSKEEINKLSDEEMELHQSNKLYRLVGLWECRWKDPTERAILRQELKKYYLLSEVETLHPVLVAANGDAESNDVINMTVAENAPLVVPSMSSRDIGIPKSENPPLVFSSMTMDAIEADVKSKMKNIECSSSGSYVDNQISDTVRSSDEMPLTPDNVSIDINQTSSVESVSLETSPSSTMQTNSQDELSEPIKHSSSVVLADPVNSQKLTTAADSQIELSEPIKNNSSALLADPVNSQKLTISTNSFETEEQDKTMVRDLKKNVIIEEALTYDSEEGNEAMNAQLEKVTKTGKREKSEKSNKKKSKKNSTSYSSEKIEQPNSEKPEHQDMPTSTSTSPNVSERLARTSMPTDSRPEQSIKSSTYKAFVEPTTITSTRNDATQQVDATPKKGFGKLLKGFLKKK